MGETLHLTAADGHVLTAWRADPAPPTKGSVVVIQEVFGVNAHIRDVCDRFAAAGYTAIAPALFDRLEHGVELGYDEAGITAGRGFVGRLGWETPVLDVDAAARSLRADGRVAVVGYCWGGTIAWLAACRLQLACAVPYYGRQIIDFAAEKPRCPVIMHFGGEDPLIPRETVAAVQAAHPEIPIYLYEGAGHGFNCDRRADYRPEAAALALERTMAFYATHLSQQLRT
jgi:Dienelactone hydrolase and related enzymes